MYFCFVKLFDMLTAKVNSIRPDRWNEDTSLSVLMYNEWFLNFAPTTFKEERLKCLDQVIQLSQKTNGFKEISEDFRITFFKISKDMFSETLSTLWRPASGFLLYMRKHIVSIPDGELIGRFLAYCNLLVYRMKHTPQNCRQESIMQLLRVYFWDVYTVYINDPQAEKSLKFTRKDEYVYQFVRLIIEDHSPDKDVAYFAQKLGISPKRLTNLIRSISGQSAREWIVYYTILEIKSLLRESSLDIKSIAARVNFPDQTTLSRYFRHYTGVTPSQYRKNIYF